MNLPQASSDESSVQQSPGASSRSWGQFHCHHCFPSLRSSVPVLRSFTHSVDLHYYYMLFTRTINISHIRNSPCPHRASCVVGKRLPIIQQTSIGCGVLRAGTVSVRGFDSVKRYRDCRFKGWEELTRQKMEYHSRIKPTCMNLPPRLAPTKMGMWLSTNDKILGFGLIFGVFVV